MPNDICVWDGWMFGHWPARQWQCTRQSQRMTSTCSFWLRPGTAPATTSACVRLRRPTVIDSVHESQPGYGGIAILYSTLLQCMRVEVPQVKTFEALYIRLLFLFFSRPRSEGWPHHGRTFSIYPCPLSVWLTLPRRVLSTSWCCPSRLCVAFLAFVHLALFLALSLSPGNSLVSSLCDHSMLASLLWRCLTVPSLLQLC